jgi:hypothetical protein
MLKQIITKLFCLHKWKKESERIVESELEGTWVKGTYFCEICGKIKQIKI